MPRPPRAGDMDKRQDASATTSELVTLGGLN